MTIKHWSLCKQTCFQNKCLNGLLFGSKAPIRVPFKNDKTTTMHKTVTCLWGDGGETWPCILRNDINYTSLEPNFPKKTITKTSWVIQVTCCCYSGEDHGGFYGLNMYFRQGNNKLM